LQNHCTNSTSKSIKCKEKNKNKTIKVLWYIRFIRFFNKLIHRSQRLKRNQARFFEGEKEWSQKDKNYMYVKIKMYMKSKVEKLNIETMDERETKKYRSINKIESCD